VCCDSTRETDVDKEHHGNCKTGCLTYRCTCLKSGEPCDENCGCADCQNPLNGVNVESLSICAIQNIEACKALTVHELETAHNLLCGHERVLLKDLLGTYLCQECSAGFWYSCYGNCGRG
jgi:hypothetical protein